MNDSKLSSLIFKALLFKNRNSFESVHLLSTPSSSTVVAAPDFGNVTAWAGLPEKKVSRREDFRFYAIVTTFGASGLFMGPYCVGCEGGSVGV